MENLVLNKNKVKDFTLNINNGCFYWKCILIDDSIYQIYFKIVSNITSKGNKSRRKIYYIKVNNKELIFDDEVKKWFYSFRRPYLTEGI